MYKSEHVRLCNSKFFQIFEFWIALKDLQVNPITIIQAYFVKFKDRIHQKDPKISKLQNEKYISE